MRAVQYIFINKGLGMSPGKIAAQAGHAAVEGYKATSSPALIDAWYEGKHYTKLVMEARDEAHLYTIERYLKERGFRCALIIDEGHTEIPPHTATAIGCAIVDKDDPHTAATFSDFKLYREQPPKPLIIETDRRVTREQVEEIKALWREGRYEEAKLVLPRREKPNRTRRLPWHRHRSTSSLNDTRDPSRAS